jgi:2-oxoisovalerate dehydrogenase E1 component alpha subunit
LIIKLKFFYYFLSSSVFDVPLIFFCRNNGYAISTPVKEQYRGDGIASRGQGYGMATVRVDGNDIFAVYNATKEARRIAIQESRPVLIEAMTYRLGHHSTSDDSTAYRSIDEMNSWEKDDNPINRFKSYLIAKGWWDIERDQKLDSYCHKEVMESFQTAELQKRAKPTEIFEDVYKTMPAHLLKQKTEMINHLKLYKKEYSLELYEKF